MSDDPLFTLKQLADELGLPESTVRYYRDAFLDHIPSVGTGRRRRYPAAAIAVLRTIAKHYAAGKPRAEIIAAIAGSHPGGAAVPVETQAAPQARAIEEVSNVDLLAAILDGEREQRDALWQMAKEIIRLTEVLESQDKVLGDIADRAGVTIAAPRPAPLLGAAPAASPPPATVAAPPPPAEPQAFTPTAPTPPQPAPRETTPLAAALFGGSPIMPPPVALPPRESGASRTTLGHEDIEKLRNELESERALVERLRESKLQLEHRVVDAEADLEAKRQRRPSVIQRLLRSDE